MPGCFALRFIVDSYIGVKCSSRNRYQYRQIRFHPSEIRRKVQTIGPGVQTGSQVQHPVTAVGDRLGDGVVDDLGARDQPPPVASRPWNLGDDSAAVFTGETLGERVAEQRIRPCRYGCPVQCRPPRRIEDVGNGVPSARHTLRYGTRHADRGTLARRGRSGPPALDRAGRPTAFVRGVCVAVAVAN
jgi:hypothetical protein